MSASDYVVNTLSQSASEVTVAPISRPAAPAEPSGAASPLRSAESFEAYYAVIQQRLSEHAAKRAHFLQSAHDRLTRLLQTARAVEDSALYNELWQHRVAARELLEALQKLSPASEIAAAPLPAKPLPLAPANGRYGSEMERTVSMPTSAVKSPPPPLASLTGPRDLSPAEAPYPEGTGPVPDQGYADSALPRMPRRALRPLGDIEADAMRLRTELKETAPNRPLLTRQGDLNVPNCLWLRSMACRQRRLEEEAGDTEVAEVTELVNDIVDLLDEANDQEYTVALDDELDPRPTAYQWGELSDRYEEMAKAQEAFEWWTRHRALLAVTDVQGLAESVAAIQQRFNRMLFRVGARDPFQQHLFDALRTWAKEAQCYLHSLRPKVPMSELVERAATLEECWEKARAVIAEEGHRQQIVDNVIALVSEPGFGTQDERDEERLREAVAECRLMRIPASDRRLRDALLPWGAFLEGDDRFKEVLREINLEWERRQDMGKPEDITEEPEPALDSISAELEAVREITRGKRCLLLGGTCREENRRKIEDALELSELVWPSTKPSDPLAKYDTEIRHSEIVALLTRFSRKEWKNAQDICARDGKRFVHLTSGYGVSQVVHHFFNQICPQGTGRA